MFDIHSIPIDDRRLLGFKLELPNAPPLLVILGTRGFLMCGYLDVEVADTVGAIAAKVSGVSEIEDMLEAEVVAVTRRAKELGIKEGMSGREALRLL